jgi:hypothetical protein
MEFDATKAYDIAKEIVKTAIDNYENRDTQRFISGIETTGYFRVFL